MRPGLARGLPGQKATRGRGSLRTRWSPGESTGLLAHPPRQRGAQASRPCRLVGGEGDGVGGEEGGSEDGEAGDVEVAAGLRARSADKAT